ncbi:MAG: hypothetical protein AAF552_12435, partial [Pseudomonadota bacterium]
MNPRNILLRVFQTTPYRLFADLPVLGFFVLGLFWQSTQAAPATRTVCVSGCDFATIQEAVNASSDGDTVSLFFFSPFTESDIIVPVSITIAGMAQQQTIVQASATPDSEAGRVFSVLPGSTVKFE